MPSSSVSSPKYDANKAYPLSRNNANNANLDPHRLCYHRFQDATGTSHEIFVPAGKEREIIELEDNEDWDALLAKFPPFSDRPPVFTVQPNCLEVPMGLNSSMKRFYIPEDQAKVDRVCELVIAEDYRTLEREFELWGKYILEKKFAAPHVCYITLRFTETRISV